VIEMGSNPVQVVGFEAISIEEYASTAPNPVRFLLALQNLSIIVEEYSTTVRPDSNLH
jgi:hypothetical protein